MIVRIDGPTDAQLIETWQQRLQSGEPWVRIEAEILEHTGGHPEALLGLLLTALDLCGDPSEPREG